MGWLAPAEDSYLPGIVEADGSARIADAIRVSAPEKVHWEIEVHCGPDYAPTGTWMPFALT
jgi:hypothetical protein